MSISASIRKIADVLLSVGAIAGSLAAVMGLIVIVWSFFRKLNKIIDIVQVAKTQLFSNGGESLFDQVVKLREEVFELKGKFESHVKETIEVLKSNQ